MNDHQYHTLFVSNASSGAIIIELDFDRRIEALQFAASVKDSNFKTEIIDRSTSSMFDSLWALESVDAHELVEGW